jgi:hypothetical protein
MAQIELLRDDDYANAWLLLVDGVPQSYVDLDDPAHLDFAYIELIASVIDSAFPAGQRLTTVHIGGAGLTLPRWIAATRSGSRQLVLEPDEALTTLVRERLPLPRDGGIRVRAEGGRTGLATRAAASADLIVLDAYDSGRVPADLTTTEHAADVARVLRPRGLWIANIADAPPLGFVRRFLAGIPLEDVRLLAEPAVLRGRRYGNLVVVASGKAGPSLAGLERLARQGASPVRLLSGQQVTDFIGGAVPITDDFVRAGASLSPEPPTGTWRVPRI